jgi:hypothetical protein
LTVTFHDAARSELSEAVAFYNEKAPGLGDVFAAEVRSTVVRILAHPDAGFSVRPMVRRRLSRFSMRVGGGLGVLASAGVRCCS